MAEKWDLETIASPAAFPGLSALAARPVMP
jgi:hypothetical protein